MKTILALAILALAVSARAEDGVTVDIVGQSIWGSTASSKFNEYQSQPRGAFVGEMSVQTSTNDWFFSLDAFRPGLSDQRVGLGAGQWGVHDMRFEWNQTPHAISNNGSSYFQQTSEGVLILPPGLQSTLQAAATNYTQFFNGTKLPGVQLATTRQKETFSYAYNPAGRWRLNLNYSGESKTGTQRLGTIQSAGVEVPMPIDYRTNNMSVALEFAGKDAGFSLTDSFTDFHNSVPGLTVANPFRTSDSALTVNSSGRWSSTPANLLYTLPPDNQTHDLLAEFNTKTSAKSRFDASLGYSLQKQDQPFLPLTDNAVLLAKAQSLLNPAYQLPLGLQGDYRTLSGNANWNWRPREDLKLVLRGRFVGEDNRTPQLNVDYVSTDSGFTTSTVRTALARDKNQGDLGADVTYDLVKKVGMKLSYNWETIGRHQQAVNRTYENSYTAALNIGPVRNFTLRPSYTYQQRTVKDYDPVAAVTNAYILGANGQPIPGTGILFQDARNRRKAVVRGQWDPTGSVESGLDFGWLRDDYPGTLYGLQASEAWNASADVSWQATERWSFYTDYTWEQMVSDTYNNGSSGTPIANDWVGLLKDTVYTTNLGTTCQLIAQKLFWDASWTYSYAQGHQRASNPNAGATGSNIATDLPDTNTELSQFRTGFSYKWPKVMARLGYAYLHYGTSDWAQNVQTFERLTSTGSGAATSNMIYLGATQPGYDAHAVTASLTYAF